MLRLPFFVIVKNDKELHAFGGRVKKLRKDKKLTQLALSDLVEVDVKTIKNIEAGKNYNPTLSLIYSLAKALKVDIKELF